MEGPRGPQERLPEDLDHGQGGSWNGHGSMYHPGYAIARTGETTQRGVSDLPFPHPVSLSKDYADLIVSFLVD
jgi:hypothetical protein